VQRAEQAGLVARKQSTEDGRVVHLSLTDTGSRRLEEITEALDAERAHLQERLDGLEF
jgi:DNA-binding MarR family transcriptional regulator